MDMMCNNESKTQWILNLTEEEAENFEYLSKTTGYTVSGLMMSSLLAIRENPMEFMKSCDIAVLEPYKFNTDEPIIGDFDDDGHFCMFGSRLTGCRAAMDKVIGTVLEYLARGPMTTNTIIADVPEVHRMCEYGGGKWDFKTVGNEVRSMLKTVAQRTDWIEARVNGRREYVFSATPKLKEYMMVHGKFERSNLESYAILNKGKTYEELVAPVPEPEAEIPAEPEGFTADDDDNEEYIHEIVKYLVEFAGTCQKISDKYPIKNKVTDVYAKTVLDTAVRQLCECEGTTSTRKFVKRLRDAIDGDILIDYIDEKDRNESELKDSTVYRRVVEQAINCMECARVLEYDDDEIVWLRLPDKEEREEILSTLHEEEPKLKRAHELADEMIDAGFDQLGMMISVRLV